MITDDSLSATTTSEVGHEARDESSSDLLFGGGVPRVLHFPNSSKSVILFPSVGKNMRKLPVT